MYARRTTLLLVAIAAACRTPHEASSDPRRAIRCDTMIHFGLSVEVHDALTGAWIADSAVVLAQMAASIDTLTPGAVSFDGTLRERRGVSRPGVYDLEVRRAGYKSWHVSAVEVKTGRCGIISTSLRAFLLPDH